jgi:hypothetical protein
MHFLFGGWRDGLFGAFRLGVEHGAWCVGCCWALMAALFALGIMSVAWMAFVAALIAAEKLLPWRRTTLRGMTVLLAVLGVAVAVVPDRVPGLTQPDSAEGRDARMMMRDDRSKHSPELDARGRRWPLRREARRPAPTPI